MTITEFLNARYDEEEEAVTRWDIALYEDNQGVPAWIINARGLVSPDHSLADIAAKRAIVALHSPFEDRSWKSVKVGQTVTVGYLWCRSCGSPDTGPDPYPCRTVRLLARPYAEHADFDPAWRT